MIRESGGDRSAVTGGTRVLSDEIVVRITAQAGRDVPRPHDRARRGRRPAEDAERDRPDDPARRPDDHLPAGGRDAAAVRHLLRRRADDHRARRPARVPHPDDDRRAALGDRHRRHGPPGAAQRAGDVAAAPSRPPATCTTLLLDKTGTITFGIRQAAEFIPVHRRRRDGARRGGAAVVAGRRDARGPLDRRPRRSSDFGLATDRRPGRGAGAVHRPDPHVRHGLDDGRQRAQGRRRLGAPLRRGRGRRVPARAAADRRAGVAGRRAPRSSSSTDRADGATGVSSA